MKKVLFIIVFFSLSIHGFAKLPILYGDVDETLLLRDRTDKFELEMAGDSIFVTTNFSNEKTFRLAFQCKNDYTAYLNLYKLKKIGCFRTKYYVKRSELEDLLFIFPEVDKITFCNNDYLSYSWFCTFPDFQGSKLEKWLCAYIFDNPGVYAQRNICYVISEDDSRFLFVARDKDLYLYSSDDRQYGLTIDIKGLKNGGLVTESVLVPFRGMGDKYGYTYFVEWSNFYRLIDVVESIVVRDKNGTVIIDFYASDIPNNFEQIYYAIQAACVTENYIMFPH